MPTRRLFEPDDSVIIEIDDKKRKGTIAEYDAKGRKVIVKYDGNKKIEDAWISTKHVTRVDKNGKPVQKARSRSTSRGRTPAAKKNKSPARSSSRTRSSSRGRKPKANSADFSSADEAALNDPTPVKIRKSPARKKATKTPAKAKTFLKDAQFSADDEPEKSTPAKKGKSKNQVAIEKNSKDTTAAEPAAKACKYNFLKINLCGFCPVKSICCCWKQMVDFAFSMFNMFMLICKLTLNNLPMVLTWYVANASIFFLMDKKNVRLNHFHKDNFQLPAFPYNFDFIMNIKLMSCDFNVWKANFMSVWNVVEFPVYLMLCFKKIDYLQNYFGGFKMIVGSSPRVSTKVNLRKVWLTQILFCGFVIYFDSILSVIDQYFPTILANPITPYFRQVCLWLNGKFYNILTAVFLNSKKYYFSLILLAAFQAYSDHDFDVTTKFQDWFLNADSSTNLKTRFVYTYGFEMASHLAFLVLAVKNPTNKWLWLLVNTNFVQGFLATRSTESPNDGQSAEATTIRRFYQGTLISGFWFYFMQIYKLFTVMSFWRFINKTKTMTSCQYQLYAFAVVLMISNILKFQAGANYPSEKRFGIHGKIRNAGRLAEILYVASLVLLCDFKFGNAPLVMLALYTFMQILDIKIAEACALQKSRTKWAAYHTKVPFRFIPKVW